MLDTKLLLDEDQRDCLQELMNISYGSATAAIAQIIDKFATLNIPSIKTITSSDFEEYFTKKFEKYDTYFVSNQKTDGKLAGENLFIMDETSVTNLAKEFDLEDDEIDDDELKDVKKVFQDAKSGDFEEISELLDDSISKDVKSVGKELESDLKQVYVDSKDATSLRDG